MSTWAFEIVDNPSHMALDWLLVVACALSLLITIVYLFYFNRILAFLLGYLLHLNWWNEGSGRAWVSLGAIFLAFRSPWNIYVGVVLDRVLPGVTSGRKNNDQRSKVSFQQSIFQNDQMSRHLEVLAVADKRGIRQTLCGGGNPHLPSRFHISLEGVEWRLYNRTAAFNDILVQLQRQSTQNEMGSNEHGLSVSAQSQDVPAFVSDGADAPSRKSDIDPRSTPASPTSLRLRLLKKSVSGWFAGFKLDVHELLPVDIEAVHGAIVLGNPSTRSLLVAKFSGAKGSYGVVPARSLHDKYKTVIDAKFRNVKFDFERNNKYRGSLVQHGRIISRHLGTNPTGPQLLFSAFTRLWTNRTRSETQHKIDDTHAKLEAQQEKYHNDYAIVETILETPQLDLLYYWDVPGVVPFTHQKGNSAGLESHDVGNGDLAPQYGIDLVVHGGIARYGPWADRQRVELQRLFFPPTFQTMKPTTTLKPGDTRVYTALKVFIELRDTITFHIPFREPSKDWQFDEIKFPGSTRKRREGGWLEVHAGGNSTINYVLPWVATQEGYDTLLELHFDQVNVLSSVNDIHVLKAASSRVLCELPTPLRWNDPRQWTFDVSFQSPTFHVIRDHINLLTDLGKDWSSGPPSDFDKWIPMHYVVNTALQDFEVNLYLNDHNIITRPHARDVNTLLTLRSSKLRSSVEIPSTAFRPQYTKVPFWVEIPGASFSLTLPKWNTHATFAMSRTTDFCRLGSFRIDAFYRYYSTTLPEYIDQLKLDISGRDMVLLSFGWLVRHMMTLRENYFGNFTQFSTLTEYVTKRDRNDPVGDPLEWKWREGKSNVLEVSLSVRVEQSALVFPAGLPGYEYSLEQSPDLEQHSNTEDKGEYKGLGTCVIMLLPEFQVQLRTHDYSMELSININPVTVSVVDDLIHDLTYESYQRFGRQKLQIDGINVLANRLFGLQPRTSAYLCLWEFQIGAVMGIASTMEFRGLLTALTSFRLNAIDVENAPAHEFTIPPEPDVTFVKFSLKSLDVAWAANQTSVHLCLPQGIKLDYNDLAGNTYKKVTEIRIPQAVIRALARSRMSHGSWLEGGSVSFDVGMNIYSSPSGWHEAAKAQTRFLAAQDVLTRRAWFLYEKPSAHLTPPAPSSYQNDMFLPKPMVPGRYFYDGTPRDRGVRASGKPRSRHTARALRAHDSEEDEHISEADRDARLAHSRPATPLAVTRDYDDRSMSSADESDSGDITSIVSGSESDVAEPDDSNVGVLTQLLSHYKNIVRRFESHLDDLSIFSSSSLFNVTRDIPPLSDLPSHTIASSCPPKAYHHHWEGSQDSSKNVTVRLVRSNDVDVLVTPLCTHVIKDITDQIVNLNTSLELVVDFLTQEYIGDVGSDKIADSSQEVSDLDVCSVRLRILQSLAADEEIMTPLPTRIRLPGTTHLAPERARVVSDIVLVLQDLSANLSKSFVPSSCLSKTLSAFRGSLSQVQVYVDMSIRDGRTPGSSRQCTIVIEKTTAISHMDTFCMKLGDTRIQFLGEASPAIVAASLDSLISMIRESKLHAKKIANSKAARHHQIWSILQSCRGITVHDPLNQTQPSYLVQFGRPGRLRRDPSWKLFRYLRHCLRFFGTSHRELLLKGTSPADVSSSNAHVDEIFSVLHQILSEWGLELPRQELSFLPFVRYCFLPAMHSSTEKPRGSRKHLVLSFHSGTLSFSVFESQIPLDDSLGNTFTVGPTHLLYRYRDQKITMPPGKVPLPVGGAVSSESDSVSMRHHVLSSVVEDIHLTIHPSFIVFLQRILRSHGKYFRPVPKDIPMYPPSIGSPIRGRKREDYWEYFAEVRQISIQAAVEGMVLELGTSNVSFVMPVLHDILLPWTQPRLRQIVSGKGLLKLSELYTRVRQAHDKKDPFSPTGRDILTSLTFISMTIDMSYRITGEQSLIIHGLLAMNSVMLSVPRSALLTYRLIEEWRTQYLPNIHIMTQDLLAELDKDRHGKSSRKRTLTVPHSPLPVVEVQTLIKRVGMSLQVMHGTWFSWDVDDIVGFLRSIATSTRSPRFTFGMQLASQRIRIGAQPGDTGEKTVKTIKLALPSIRASGDYDGFHLRSHAIIDQFSLTLKPKYVDDILVVQQNLGTHFYDVLDVIAEGRKNRPLSKPLASFPVNYDAAFRLEGFRIGIEGPTTTLALTSAQMTGKSRNEIGLAWDFAVSNLALALSHHSTDTRPRFGFDRSLRSAYMVLDVNASSSMVTTRPGAQSFRVLRLHVSRMHAVMSPNSVGELGDLIDHVQAEKHIRQEQRALELEEIKNKTKRVMRAFELQKPTTSLRRSSAFFDNQTVLIDVADIGVAFPLALRNEIEVDIIGSVPAFLVSVKTATFSLKQYESGQASMRGLSFQFVNQFDQSSPSQFDGDQHKSRNMLLYPGMKAEFRSGTSIVARRWHVAAHVDGFVLDLDPGIVDNVFGLVDVYRKGRERIDRLTALPPATKSGSNDMTATAAVGASYVAIRPSNILVTLVFHTGKLRLRGLQLDDIHVAKPDGRSPLEASSDVPDVVQFPTITVWGEYRAMPAVSKVPDTEPSVLIFRSQVHTTINRIKPSIFPFLIGIVERFENRFRHPEVEPSVSNVTVSSTSDISNPDNKDFLAPDVLNGIQLSFSLRIDSSKLELDCGYDLGVVAALHWESGGFLVTLSPQAGIAYFAGSVTGLEVDLRHLKHQAGTVQTARVSARNLSFSVSYSQMDAKGGLEHSVSVVMDTEFGAALRFDRLQDILIFKAIYVDRLPGTVHQPSTKASVAGDGSPAGPFGLTTLVLLRARHIKLQVDLGHNVAAVMMDLETVVFRSRLSGSVTDLAVSIAHTSLDLEEDRPLGGYMRLPEFSFATVRRSDAQLGIIDGIAKMLDVTLASGTLDIVLLSEKRTLLQYHAKPFDIHIADDWSAIDWNIPPGERTLRLDFSVVGMEILAVANLQSIPRIIMLLSKLRSDLDVQQADARNALTTSSIAHLPKPESTLSAVADAMIRSARSRYSDSEAFSYIILQRMKLRLSTLRLALFKTPNDLEMALFEGKDVSAELERIVHSFDMPPSRSLKLSFSSLYLSKYASLKYRAIGDDLMARPWLERLLKGASEWTIARVPAMNLEMNSDVEYEDGQEILHYDLVATTDEQAQSSRSIYVSLNLSLYIWAGALVKGLGLEIERALLASGFNNASARAAATATTFSPSQAPPMTSHDAKTKLSELSFTPSFTTSSTPVMITSHEGEARLSRKYHARSETSIDYGTIQQLGEATPDAKAPWLGLKETVPPRVHEYATLPMEVLMKVLLGLYSKQLKRTERRDLDADFPPPPNTGGFIEEADSDHEQ